MLYIVVIVIACCMLYVVSCCLLNVCQITKWLSVKHVVVECLFIKEDLDWICEK